MLHKIRSMLAINWLSKSCTFLTQWKNIHSSSLYELCYKVGLLSLWQVTGYRPCIFLPTWTSFWLLTNLGCKHYLVVDTDHLLTTTKEVHVGIKDVYLPPCGYRSWLYTYTVLITDHGCIPISCWLQIMAVYLTRCGYRSWLYTYTVLITDHGCIPTSLWLQIMIVYLYRVDYRSCLYTYLVVVADHGCIPISCWLQIMPG